MSEVRNVARPCEATTARPMRAALVVNPTAGSAPAGSGAIEELAAALAESGFALVAPVRSDLGLDLQLQAALAHRPDAVFALGGDGTLRAVAESILGTGIVLGILPGGTMNRLAARLDIPPDPLMAARLMAGATTVALTHGMLNGRVFLYQSVVGRPSRLVRFREMQRGVGLAGWLPLILAVLRSIARPPRRSLRLRADGRRIGADAVVVTVPPPDAPPRVQVDAVRRAGVMGGLRQGWRWLRGRLAQDQGVTTAHRAQLAVHGLDKRLRVTLDGEQHLLAPPLRFRLRADTLRVLRPRRG